MSFSILPRQDKFFDLFEESAANLNITAEKLVDLMGNYENVPLKVAEIKRLEEVGDGIIHNIMTLLHKTFITPLDREDIVAIGERLDDVLDCIEEAARCLMEYRIDKPTESAKELSQIILSCCSVLTKAMALLRQRGSKLQGLIPLKVELNVLENKADHVASKAIAELFDSYPAIEVIKWKEVYNQLEGATDRCEDIAGIMEGVVIKNA